MAKEWWTSPSEASRRLDALSAFINTLRNTALGRGVRPNVSDELADWIAAEHTAYHQWRDSLPSGWVYGAVSWVDELDDWTARANLMRSRIAGELGQGAVPAAVTQWQGPIGPEDARMLLSGLGGLVFALGAVWIIAKRRGGSSAA